MNESDIRDMAIKRFVLNVTLPLLFDTSQSAKLLATGTLFKIDGRAFIITARHAIASLKGITLGFPDSPHLGLIHPLGEFKVHMPQNGQENIDVAAIELLTPRVINALEANWQFLSLDNVASASRHDIDSAYFVAGYPDSLTWSKGNSLISQFIVAYTQMCPIPEEASQPVIEDMDFFFDYAKTATALDGTQMPTPELPGVSGASIWELQIDTARIWTAERSLRVVGVQSSYIHSKYLRAKSWWAVAKVLEQTDARLALHLREAFQ